jgi:choline dehydrogenase
MLLEAGSAYAPNLYPADLANADIVGGPDGHDWGFFRSRWAFWRAPRASAVNNNQAYGSRTK